METSRMPSTLNNKKTVFDPKRIYDICHDMADRNFQVNDLESRVTWQDTNKNSC